MRFIAVIFFLVVQVAILTACEEGAVTPTSPPPSPTVFRVSPTPVIRETAPDSSPTPAGTLLPSPSGEPSFTTIDQGYFEGDQYATFPVRKPQLVIFQDERDLDLLVLRGQSPRGGDLYRVTERALAEISRIDLQKNVVLIAFAAENIKPDAQIRIDEVWKGDDGTIYLRAFIHEPRESTRATRTRIAYHALTASRSQFLPEQGI